MNEMMQTFSGGLNSVLVEKEAEPSQITEEMLSFLEMKGIAVERFDKEVLAALYEEHYTKTEALSFLI